jgi:hypothetical protein
MTRYWIGVVSKNHLIRGVNQGFAQSGNGRRLDSAQMHKGDIIQDYSPKLEYGGTEPLHAFTAMG